MYIYYIYGSIMYYNMTIPIICRVQRRNESCSDRNESCSDNESFSDIHVSSGK